MNRGWHNEGWRHSLSARGVRTYRSVNIAAWDATKYKERIPGGRAEGMGPQHFDKVQLNRGENVEMEHTNNRQIARELAQDHLAENPNYYKELEKIESKNPGRVATANGTPIYAERLDEGFIYPVTPEDAKKVLQSQGENTKGLKAVRFVMPKDKQQKGAYAQYVRSKREILIFAQRHKGGKVSGMDGKNVRRLLKSYVIPHEVGHHRALRTLPTDKSLKVAEARADAHAAGMSVNDRDVRMFNGQV